MDFWIDVGGYFHGNIKPTINGMIFHGYYGMIFNMDVFMSILFMAK